MLGSYEAAPLNWLSEHYPPHCQEPRRVIQTVPQQYYGVFRRTPTWHLFKDMLIKLKASSHAEDGIRATAREFNIKKSIVWSQRKQEDHRDMALQDSAPLQPKESRHSFTDV